MIDPSTLLQVGGLVFALGMLWERLNSLNKKVTEQNGKLSKALVTIAKLEVARLNSHERVEDIYTALTDHIKEENTRLDAVLEHVRSAN